MRNILIVLMFGFGMIGFSQELNCTVVVNAKQTGNENLPIFKTLEKQLKEFVNNTSWTSKNFATQERIDCSMIINVVNYSGEAFQASLQVQSSRPVFGSSFTSPVYNFNDKDFNFRYLEFQNLIFNPTQYESNLVSVLAFHVNMILGLDAESFSENGGDEYFKQAQTIVNYSQQDASFKGWKLADGLQSRFALIDNLLSPTFKEYKQVIYNYHRKGLDAMSGNVKEGKEQIAGSLKLFQAMNSRRPNSFYYVLFLTPRLMKLNKYLAMDRT